MRALLRRLWGVGRKELTEIVRQPGFLAVLVIGPLAILLAFGAGVRPTDPAVRAIFVAPSSDQELAEVVRDYADSQSERLTITGVTDDRESALADLRSGEVDLIVVFPEDAESAVTEGERATIEVRHSYIDPLEAQAIQLFTRGAVDDLNDRLLALVITDAQDAANQILGQLDELQESGAIDDIELDDPIAEAAAEEALSTDFGEQELQIQDARVDLEALVGLDADVIAAPLEGDSESIGGAVTTSQFYGPAVVALILQHITLTFVALARVRERELGTTELFAVSPLRPIERIAGQSIAYLIFGLALGAALLGAVVGLLGAPIRGGIGPVTAVVALEVAASIGVGLLLSRVAKTTTQVVQGSMLILLVSIFFGGLLLSPERLLPWARPIGWFLPMTHALELLRDSMLRGFALDPTPMQALGAMAVALFLGVGVWAQRRPMDG